MTRILFLPDARTLLWLDLDQPEDRVLADLRAGKWRPPPPYETIPTESLNAAYQDGVITITLRQKVEPRPPAPPVQPKLSRRQSEVLKGLADGLTTRQICLRLKISRRTVYVYVAELKTLFQAQTRAELLMKAAGLIKKV